MRRSPDPTPRVSRPRESAYFYGALKGGQRSPNTWKVWGMPHTSDVYLTSRELGRLVKTSLHQSGKWHTRLEDPGLAGLWPEVGSRDGRLDHWTQPPDLSPGIVHAFMIVMPSTQLVPWAAPSAKSGTARLIMEPGTALAVDVLMLRPTLEPVPLHVPNSVVFARFEIGDGREVVLVSRRLEWSDDDERKLEEMKQEARTSSRTLTDPRPISDDPGVTHMTRMTVFGTGDRGTRFVVDAYDPRPVPGRE